jgi:hypothetical protein
MWYVQHRRASDDMTGITYSDFVLLVDKVGDVYRVRIDASPAGSLELRQAVRIRAPKVQQFLPSGAGLTRDARPVGVATGAA